MTPTSSTPNEQVAALRANLLEVIDFYDRSPLGSKDVMGVVPVLARAGLAWWSEPGKLFSAGVTWATGVAESAAETLSLAWGLPAAGKSAPDSRFADPAWSTSPGFFWLRAQFERWQQAVLSLVDGADLSQKDRDKLRYLLQNALDAAAPSNVATTNPAVIKRALETGGASLVRGFQNFLDDLANNNGQPKQFAEGVYEVGKNLAVTPGRVVFRNDLIELLQYSPTTETVHQVPMLFSPPWINKYYIMDLAPGRSLVEWAVAHGHTVFAISYRNPDESMRDIRLDDYLISGPRAALDVICDITGSDKVNLVGLCLGGTLTMAALAHLKATHDDRINSATFLNTLVDFANPGVLGVTTDERTVSKLDAIMAETGFLPAVNMSLTFDSLRAKDLIWNYVVRNWLLGEDPPAFDLLSWNSDSTRMPAAMHSFYLRSCYVENQLANGRMELAGQRLDPRAVDVETYFLAAEQDHIVPWRSSYAGARLPSGNTRFVLSNAGHIAGVVNPPNPKSKFWVNADLRAGSDLPESPDAWLAGATLHTQTWWEDWAEWAGARAGERVSPPSTGNDRFPPLAEAPGTYVLGR